MARMTCFAFLVLVLASSIVSAEDYLLRIEAVGFRERKVDAPASPQEILDSIEVVAKPNEPFYASATIGAQKVSLKGVIERLDDGRFKVQFKYAYTKFAEKLLPVPNAQKTPLVSAESGVNSTSTIVNLGIPIPLGGMDSSKTEKDKAMYQSNTKNVLSLIKFDPANMP